MNPPSKGQFRVSNLAAFVWASGYAERLVGRSGEKDLSTDGESDWLEGEKRRGKEREIKGPRWPRRPAVRRRTDRPTIADPSNKLRIERRHMSDTALGLAITFGVVNQKRGF